MMEMDIIFVDWTPTEHRSDIRKGGQIRRYYAWMTLNNMVNKVIPFRKENGNINWKSVRCMFKKNSKIWVEYGCGRIAHFFVLFVSFVRSKGFILNVHDFVVQQKFVDKDAIFIKKFQLRFIERLLLQYADTIILASPGLLDYFTPGEKTQKILIMPPGVGEDELLVPPPNKNNGKNIALYFGSMQRKGAIPRIVELFSELQGWELHLVGLMEREEIVEKENVKYLGSVSHDKLHGILSNADVILIPLPKNDYLDKAMHIKIGYALKSCRPVIATKLSGISNYVSILGLEENVIYMEEWDLENLKDALQKAQSLNINPEMTIEKLRPMAWEPRFKKAIEIVLDISQASSDQIEWV
jgi:hypothetical protein